MKNITPSTGCDDKREDGELRLVTFTASGSQRLGAFLGGNDKVVWTSNTEHLGNALRQLAVPVTVRIYPNRGHADTVASLSWVVRFRTPTLADIDRFMHSLPR